MATLAAQLGMRPTRALSNTETPRSEEMASASTSSPAYPRMRLSTSVTRNTKTVTSSERTSVSRTTPPQPMSAPQAQPGPQLPAA